MITGYTALCDDCDRWLERVHPEDAAQFAAEWKEALQRPGQMVQRELRLVRPDGSVAWVYVQSLPEVAPAKRGSGTPEMLSLVASFTDITERKALEQERMDALGAAAALQRDRAEEAERHRREMERFIDVVCHEIRNPLNGIVNTVDVMRGAMLRCQQLVAADGADAAALAAFVQRALPDWLEALDAMDLCTLHQRRITDDVLEVSRLHAGRYTLTLRPERLDRVVEQARLMFATEAHATDIALAWAPGAQEAARVRVLVDRQRLLQILINFLSNAVKFTRGAPARHVTIDVAVDYAALAPAKRVLVTLAVADTGIGMTPEEQAKLFVPFSQASSKTYTTYGGSGMGLFIVKELVELLGGRLAVASERGRGSTFSVQLPMDLAPPDLAPPATPPAEPPPGVPSSRTADRSSAEPEPAPPAVAATVLGAATDPPHPTPSPSTSWAGAGRRATLFH